MNTQLKDLRAELASVLQNRGTIVFEMECAALIENHGDELLAALTSHESSVKETNEGGGGGEAELLRELGLDPERFRSEGGHLNAGKILAALRHPDDYAGLYLPRESRTPQPRGEGMVRCDDCGLPYSSFPLDVVLPDDQWHAIQGREGGVLCAACILARGVKLPGVTVAKLHFPDLAATPAGGGDADAAEAKIEDLENLVIELQERQ